MVMITLYVRQQKRHRCIEQSFGLCGRGRGWDDLGECHSNMSIYHTWNELPVQVQCMIQGARGWCTGMTQTNGMGRKVLTLLEMFGSIHLWSCLFVGILFVGRLLLLIKFIYWQSVCSHFLFLLDSVLGDYAFLGICPFLLNCPFYWHTIFLSNIL